MTMSRPPVALLTFATLALTAGCAARVLPPPRAGSISFAGMNMMPLDGDTYVEPATPPPIQERLRQLTLRAAGRIDAFYGARVGPRPLVIFCGTEPCRLHFVGPTRRSWSLAPGHRADGARYVARDRQTIIVVRTDPHAEQVLTHELSHVELQARARPGRAPTWFDEGVATYLGREQDCASVTPTPIARLSGLDDDDAWFAWTSRRGALIPAYCGARREVAAWLERHGVAQLLALLDGLRAGRSFDELYRRRPAPGVTERRPPARCRRWPASA